MGKRGPAPEPSILKYIRGNPSKEKLNTAEPTPELFPQDYSPPKTRYCIESVLYLVCYEKVKTAGEEYIHWEPDPNRTDGKLRIKYTQVAPWATQMHRHHAAMLRIEQEFGMTPSSRSQVSTTNGNEADQIAAFVQKRGKKTGA